jgi:hypothetical protein
MTATCSLYPLLKYVLGASTIRGRRCAHKTAGVASLLQGPYLASLFRPMAICSLLVERECVCVGGGGVENPLSTIRN